MTNLYRPFTPSLKGFQDHYQILADLLTKRTCQSDNGFGFPLQCWHPPQEYPPLLSPTSEGIVQLSCTKLGRQTLSRARLSHSLKYQWSFCLRISKDSAHLTAIVSSTMLSGSHQTPTAATSPSRPGSTKTESERWYQRKSALDWMGLF